MGRRGFALMVAAAVVPALAVGIALGVAVAVAVDRLGRAFGDPIEWNGDDDD